MKDCACWEIMQCNDESCVARKMLDKECWEIVEELEDYRTEFNICKDCLVYVLKTGRIDLSDQEIAVMAASKSCVLAN